MSTRRAQPPTGYTHCVIFNKLLRLERGQPRPAYPSRGPGPARFWERVQGEVRAQREIAKRQAGAEGLVALIHRDRTAQRWPYQNARSRQYMHAVRGNNGRREDFNSALRSAEIAREKRTLGCLNISGRKLLRDVARPVRMGMVYRQRIGRLGN